MTDFFGFGKIAEEQGIDYEALTKPEQKLFNNGCCALIARMNRESPDDPDDEIENAAVAAAARDRNPNASGGDHDEA